MKRKYQEHQQDPKCIRKIGRCRKKFTVGKQDKNAGYATKNKEQGLPAVVGFQGNKTLEDIVAIMV